MTNLQKIFRTYLLLGLLILSALFPTGCGALAERPPIAAELEDVPAYEGEPYVEVAGNEPDFSEEDLEPESYESYSDLDSLGRCGIAQACVGQDLMPTEDRESIGQIKPTGWHTVKYEGVDGNYLYNRCHLIGFQLTAENANPENLITGTRFMNVDGMLPFENEVAEYVRETNNHVLYRVTPIFDGDNLVASGVQMEALSVEDNGAGVSFNVYVYNIQPDVVINYANGESQRGDPTGDPQTRPVPDAAPAEEPDSDETTPEDTSSEEESRTYILNKNTQKFHLPDCSGVADIKPRNKETFTGDRDTLLERGYEPCGSCNP